MLENDIKDKHGKFEGVYTFHGVSYVLHGDTWSSNGMDYWVDAEGRYVLWFDWSAWIWMLGYLSNFGISDLVIYSVSNSLELKCPNNEGFVWNWNFWDGSSYIATNDVNIKCANEDDFCTSENPCVTDQGDCDTHDECQEGLSCGSNNCPDSLGFHSEFDCCYIPTVGDQHFCTTSNPCAVDEGDCDFNNECQANLFCDADSSCPAYLGFASDMNCCFSGSGCETYNI